MNQEAGWLLLIICFVGVTVLLSVIFVSRVHPVSVTYAGSTNGWIGITNGAWSIFVVSNRTQKALTYAGAQLQFRKAGLWEADPDAIETEIGWRGNPARFWQTGPTLGGHGTIYLFIAAPPGTNAWRANLAFAEPLSRPLPAWLPRFTYRWVLGLRQLRQSRIRYTTPPSLKS